MFICMTFRAAIRANWRDLLAKLSAQKLIKGNVLHGVRSGITINKE
jgi:hypothetical protein